MEKNADKTTPESFRRVLCAVHEVTKRTKLNPYMVYTFDPSEVAVLVWAKTERQARLVAWREVSEELVGGYDRGYFDLRARLIRDNLEWLIRCADPEKFVQGVPHAVDNPPCCGNCQYWGSPLDDEGICQNCREEEREI